MTQSESPVVAPGIAETVLKTIQDASAPLNLKDVVKGLSRPKKVKVADFLKEVRQILEEATRSGQAFHYPSGSKGTERFWAKDEKQVIRDEILRAVATPLTPTKLQDAVKKSVPGIDKSFVESVATELIAEGRLFKHPKGKSFLYASSPLNLLASPQIQKLVQTFTDAARKLRDKARQSLEDLVAILCKGLSADPAPETTSTVDETPLPDLVELDDLILKAVSSEGGSDGTMSIAGLRNQMPLEYRGAAFDEAVFRLASLDWVFLLPDNRADQLEAAERNEMVRDGNGTYFCQIGLRE